ncbi:flagellar biosynthesis protein FlgJ [Buchnera aphidicola (Macrosiphoniella sanborni)]|uniref:Flagellar biosynthesis protein FlgJ n=1 Tax=Buchnera aphidicola (Macrosiphoniella sanborni) TaxID=1241865 RepID=A0A4D6YD15_9GAMM|nr:rod-binding protein [Buchnera aphidicola]QCI23878.1 flagellar biosynthesis protein FlgJ [Buchnera aphidicola (Macrosiphoniella sanborni)]
MNNDKLSLLNISNYNTQFVHELKHHVHNDSKKYKLKIAKQVESIFIQILLKSMRNSLLKDDLLNSNQMNLYTDIYDQKISEEMSKKGIGLSDIILKQIEVQKNMF